MTRSADTPQSPWTFSLRNLSSIPPFLLIVANRNQSKLDQSHGFAERLKQAGTASRLVEAPDKPHGTLNQDIGSPEDAVTQAMMEFIAKTEGQ